MNCSALTEFRYSDDFTYSSGTSIPNSSFEPETSVALGFGFRCGFLGLLHMEIIQERLEREYNLDLVTTAPSVIYRITMNDGTVHMIDNPTNYPDPSLIAKAEEPITNAHIYAPSEYVGNIMELCQDRRGVFKDMKKHFRAGNAHGAALDQHFGDVGGGCVGHDQHNEFEQIPDDIKTKRTY